jgi:hypothetical protein
MATSNRSLLLAALRGEEHGDELRALSRRIIWWEAPAEAMADGDAFVVTVMSDGTGDEIDLVESIVGESGLLAAARAAPERAFDPGRRRIWAMRLIGTPPSADDPDGPRSMDVVDVPT